ncbi:MAG: tyrosine-type recombinase/integrase [Thermoplasmata archaeon]
MRWLDSHQIHKFVSLAKAEGFRPTSIDQGRQILLRFEAFLKDCYGKRLEEAGWQEYAAYKTCLAETGLSRATVRCYLSYLTSFYRLRAQSSQDPRLLDLYAKVRALGMVRKARSTRWRPLDLETARQLLQAATGEDHVFLMTLLYTGGRAQFYGLRVEDLDFERGEITTVVKGGKVATIPLHPTLAAVLQDHLSRQGYASAFVFRNGKDIESRRGQRANRQNAWRICKRVQRAAGIEESVHPHRFRKTLATYGKQMGLDPQFLQAILAHESVNITLDEYARVELEDVKREFAKLDLLAVEDGKGEGQTEEGRLLARLRGLAPPGKEQAWRMIINGLEGLLGATPIRGEGTP